MSVNLIFKIAAVGILVSVISQVLKAQWERGTGISDKPCRPDSCIILDCTLHI